MKKFLILFLGFCLSIITVYAKDFRFVQVTDARYSAENDNGILQNVIDDINKQRDVKFVVFTGDSLDKPQNDNLKGFIKTANNLNKPYYIVLGDKDVNKHKDMSKNQFIKYVRKHTKNHKAKTMNYVFEKQGIVFIVADGSKDVIPSTIGYYKDNVIEWIDATLDLYPNKNVVILQHFPIIPPSDRESYYTYKADVYLDMLKKHSNVKAVISGHFGVDKEIIQDGVTHISTSPLPNYKIIDILDCETSNPTIWSQIRKVN